MLGVVVGAVVVGAVVWVVLAGLVLLWLALTVVAGPRRLPLCQVPRRRRTGSSPAAGCRSQDLGDHSG